MNAPSPQPTTTAAQRWDSLDAARGIAILAMIVYHFAWDLSFLRLIETNIVIEPGWRWFARTIAGSFLFLAGVGLALAHGQGFRRAAFLRRLMKVGGAALAITIVTYVLFPDGYIFFGILHCIAVASVMALPFVRLPPWVTVAAAFLCLAAPLVFTGPVWDHPLLAWLGLGAEAPRTNDYVPIFPWLGLVLLGVAAGQGFLHPHQTRLLARWRAADPITRSLRWAGRKSLPIYLVHQPILLGILYGALQVTGPNPAAETHSFIRECRAACLEGDAQPSVCEALCDCAMARLRKDGLWAGLAAGHVTPADQGRISEVAQMCLRQASPPGP